ncbi:glycosyltransferase family 4 protein [Candidatus Methylobacter favarea]|nr:glycosyltransferase family 4 protein [Candidatus Methylobacter favarea]
MANQLNQLVQLLAKEDIQVSLVQTNAPYGYKIIENIKGARALWRLIPYLAKVWKLAGKVDVIHVLANSGWSWQLFAAPVLWTGWFRGTPVIINYRGGEAEDYFKKSIKWVRPSIKKATAVAVPSGYLKKIFSDFGIDSQIIPNIINLERFIPKDKIGLIDPLQPHLIITRNLEAIYGISTAIKAVALLRPIVPGIKLSIAGSGPQKEKLQYLVTKEKLENNIIFTGRLTPEEMAKLYQNANIMLNPTTVDNMPNSILEALASGVAVVTTDVGGIPYIVKNNNTALFAEANNPELMAKQINRLLNEPELYQELVNNGLQDVQQYAWTEIRALWLGLYEASRNKMVKK